jgi:hypothetical protein
MCRMSRIALQHITFYMLLYIIHFTYFLIVTPNAYKFLTTKIKFVCISGIINITILYMIMKLIKKFKM